MRSDDDAAGLAAPANADAPWHGQAAKVVEELRRLQSEAQLDNPAIAGATGLTVERVTRIFDGEVAVKMTELMAILEALGEQPGPFFKRCLGRS